MRRDYFICIFLLCICASLFFVCFLPLVFEYNAFTMREFSILEMCFSWAFAIFTLVVVPLYSAIFKKFWFTLGLAAYGLFINISEWMLPSFMLKYSGENMSIIRVIEGYVLKCIYSMGKAPFAGMIPAVGENVAKLLSTWILFVSLAVYAVVQLFRFYRDAYVADQLDPSRIMDSTVATNTSAAVSARRRESEKAEILGTVISAPVTSKKTSAPEQVFPVNPTQGKANPVLPSSDTVKVGGAPTRVPVIDTKKVEPDTQVIHLGPPKGNP